MAKNELEDDLKTPPTAVGMKPLEWWKVYYHDYPVLAMMAKDYLSDIGSSVPSEELFLAASTSSPQIAIA